MKNKALYLIALLIGSYACNDKEAKSPSREELLTGNSTKSWNITSSIFDADEEHETCKSTSPINTDNKWMFSKDHSFEFNNGIITEGDDCTGCCTDFANLKGTWSLFSNEDSLSIVVDTRIDNGIETTFDSDELLRGKITKLTETELIFSGLTFNKL